MRKTFFSVAALAAFSVLFSLFGCSGGGKNAAPELAADEFLIDGQLPVGTYADAVLFLVPEQGAHPRQVDSVIVGEDGRFVFRGNIEQMAKLILEFRRRVGVQQLLVVTEPGVTHVVLDSISSAHGTPQNEALQAWKERHEGKAAERYALARLRATLGGDSPLFKAKVDSFRQCEGDYNYQFLKQQGRNTLSLYLYHHMFSGDLDSLRRAELDELLLDTVDYSKPMPGFHKQ